MQHLLHIALSNAVLAAIPAVAAVLAARWRCRPALVHCLWLLALAKLLTPPLVDVRMPILKSGEATEPAGWGLPHRDAETSPVSQSVGQAPPCRPGMAHRDVQAPPVVQSAGQAPLYERILFGVWALGAAAVLAVAVSRAWRFSRLLRHAMPASRTVRAQAEQVARQLGLDRSPPVVLVSGNVSPMLWAFGARAKLVVPKELWGRLSLRQQQALLAHELAHWRRRDHYVRYIELAATALYWWHPLVWRARNRLREAEEQCCDAWVVWAWPEAAKDYAAALVETVDFVSERPVPALGSGMGTAQDLMQRVRMIMQDRTPRGLSTGGWLAVMAGALLLPLLPRVVAADGEREDAPRRQAEERHDGEVKREGEIKRDGERRTERPVARDGERRREGGEGDGAARPRPINGRIIKVEGDSLFIAVGDAQREMVVPLQAETEIILRDQKVERKELAAGLMVSITQVEGMTQSVRAFAGRIPQRRDGEPREAEARRDGEVRREGEPRREGEMRREGEGRREGAREGVRTRVPGEVLSVDGNKAVIRLTVEGRAATVETDAESDCLIAGKVRAASELKAGQKVSVRVRQGRVTFVEVVEP